jgi:hypothetical protein
MPLKLDCPRCQQTMAVPTQKAGGYVQCPRCASRVWVPDAEGDASSVAGPTAVAPASHPPQPKQASQAPSQAVLPVAPAAPTPPRLQKTARFIVAESAPSPIKPAADGKLPELKLDDGEPDANAAKQNRTAVNPLVLLAALSLSLTFSVMLVFVDFGGRGDNYEKKAAARYEIEKDYFSDIRASALDKTKRLEPHQLLLSEAQQAHARNDEKAERAIYGKVLSMLRSERGTFQKGLTGSSQRDKRLEELITTLLRED